MLGAELQVGGAVRKAGGWLQSALTAPGAPRAATSRGRSVRRSMKLISPFLVSNDIEASPSLSTRRRSAHLWNLEAGRAPEPRSAPARRLLGEADPRAEGRAVCAEKVAP